MYMYIVDAKRQHLTGTSFTKQKSLLLDISQVVFKSVLCNNSFVKYFVVVRRVCFHIAGTLWWWGNVVWGRGMLVRTPYMMYGLKSRSLDVSVRSTRVRLMNSMTRGLSSAGSSRLK